MENFFVFSEKQEKLSIVWTGEVIYKFPALEVKTWSHGLLGHVHLLRLCLDHGIGVFSGEVIQAGAQFILFYPCPQRCVAPSSLNKLPFRMGIPVVTREYTPRACRNSRKPMRLPPRHEMRPDSPALHAEQLRFPNQTHKESRFA